MLTAAQVAPANNQTQSSIMSPTLDTKEIAELLGVTRPYVTDVLTKRADFPAPKINRSARMRRWSREAVEAWASGSPQSRDAMSADVVR